MNETIESHYSQKLCYELRHSLKAKVLKTHGHAMQEPGWPDLYIAHSDWTGWIETKGPDTAIRPIQIRVIKELKERGVSVYVLRFYVSDLTKYEMQIEDEEGKIIGRIEGNKWIDMAEALLKTLKELSECGIRNNT